MINAEAAERGPLNLGNAEGRAVHSPFLSCTRGKIRLIAICVFQRGHRTAFPNCSLRMTSEGAYAQDEAASLCQLRRRRLALVRPVGPDARGQQDAAARHLPGARRDKYDRFVRQHHPGRPGDCRAAQGRRLHRSRRPHPHAVRCAEEGQSDRAASRYRGEASVAPPCTSRCRRSPSRRLGARSVQARRGERVLLRQGSRRRQSDGGDLRRAIHPSETRRRRMRSIG